MKMFVRAQTEAASLSGAAGDLPVARAQAEVAALSGDPRELHVARRRSRCGRRASVAPPYSKVILAPPTVAISTVQMGSKHEYFLSQDPS